jgi:cell division protein FtsW (lipid II flippase)
MAAAAGTYAQAGPGAGALGGVRVPNARRRSELGLLFIGVIVVMFADLLASLDTTGKLPAHAFLFLVGLVGLGVFVHVVNRVFAPNCDPVVLPVVLLLNGIGYVMISLLNPQYAGNQLGWTLLGAILYAVTLAVVRRSRDLERYRYLLGLVAFLLLMLPLAPGIGGVPAADANPDTAGVRLWIHIGTASFQPVEIAKLLLVVFFASYLVEKRELLTTSTRRIGNRLIPDLRSFGPVAAAWAASLMIMILEKDVGFSVLIFLLFMAMLWVTTGRLTYVVVGVVFFAIGTFFASHFLPQVSGRISNWLDPWKDAGGSGLQTIQAELGFGYGGLFGTGLGLGHSSLIPVAASDMIYAAIGEDLGLLGAVALLVGYVLIVGSGLRTALRARTEFARLVAVGLTAVIAFQTFVIMAGVLRVLPFTGITLPWVAYGGSSLVANYILIAVLMRISDEAGAPESELARRFAPGWWKRAMPAWAWGGRGAEVADSPGRT